MRIPISRVRSVTDTSMMFMMPTPPTSSEIPAIEQLREWIEESYRAQAPKRLVKELDAMMDPGAGR